MDNIDKMAVDEWVELIINREGTLEDAKQDLTDVQVKSLEKIIVEYM